MTIQIGIIGAEGKMGLHLISCSMQDPSLSLSWGVTSLRSSRLGQDLGLFISDHEIGALCYKDFSHLKKVDVIIDFSSQACLEKNLSYALETKTPLIVGTTGLTESDHTALQKASSQIPILWSANFSLGMTALIYASELLASFLQKNFTPHILETHHKHKKDSPSGSALRLAEAIEKGCGSKPAIQSIRSGEVVGEHTTLFLGEHEKLSLYHEAISRDAFAFGALQAAKFLVEASPGLYQVKDIFAHTSFTKHALK